MPSLGLFQAGIGGGLTATGSLDLFGYGVPFLQANTGRIKLHERLSFVENPDFLIADPNATLIDANQTITWRSTPNASRGFWFRPVINYAVGQMVSFSPAFQASPTFRPSTTLFAILRLKNGPNTVRYVTDSKS